MRQTVKHLLDTATVGEIPPERWYQMGSIDSNPQKPFGVYRFSGNTPGVTARHGSRPLSCEIWVHDVPGDYSHIEGILNNVEAIFDAVVHASAAEGESISQARWESRSPDLQDDGFGTICKMTNYSLIGRG